MSDFFRFPHTPHLAWLGNNPPRDDKVLSPADAQALLTKQVHIEEKVDGANLGFSADANGRLRVQNRGQFLVEPYSGQFGRLASWLSVHESCLLPTLKQGQMVFGEWCAARHSVAYGALPDWLVVFDIYDTLKGQFWSAQRRDAWCEERCLAFVPTLFLGYTTFQLLLKLVNSQASCFGADHLEGIVIRHDDGNWLKERAKLVRADFTQAISQHWRRRSIDWNRLAEIQDQDFASHDNALCTQLS